MVRVSESDPSSFNPDGFVNKAVTICQDKMDQKTEEKWSFNF